MLKFTPDPIFKFPVEIVPPGKKPERIELDFHHKTRDELNKMMHEDKLTLAIKVEGIDHAQPRLARAPTACPHAPGQKGAHHHQQDQ